jgi:hypothetical protein
MLVPETLVDDAEGALEVRPEMVRPPRTSGLGGSVALIIKSAIAPGDFTSSPRVAILRPNTIGRHCLDMPRNSCTNRPKGNDRLRSASR